MKNSFLLFLSFIALQFSCTKPSETNSFETSQPVLEERILPTGDNSQTSLDWAGTYFNTLPCASCEGIETWVTLKSDGTFEMKTNYLGLNDAREEIFTGNFSWDQAGSNVTLEGLIGDYPGKFKVGENQLWYLDQAGKRIEGDLADQYILKKK
ncbi:copper resistance protein NlpE [Algoriphagus sp.]|uniref:copper resistance protein NlpE n=1 Tax=Algoriphagus sp. TaxID=1872435 RepID=UPI00391912EF